MRMRQPFHLSPKCDSKRWLSARPSVWHYKRMQVLIGVDAFYELVAALVAERWEAEWDADASCTCQTSITLLRVCTSIQRRQYITLANAAQFSPRTTPTHLPIQPPTWLAISESALLWLEENWEAEGEPVHSVRAAHLPVCIKSSTVWVVCACPHMRCVWIRARLSAWWLLQDWAELQPIFPGDRDVGRHLPRHLWSSPQPNSTSGLWTPLIFFFLFVHLVLSSQNDEVFLGETAGW